MRNLTYPGASPALLLFSSSAPPAARRNDQLAAVVARLRRGVPRPLVAETHRRTRRLDMPASADKQALADELSHELRLARIVILDESRCQPTCLRTTTCARTPLSAALGSRRASSSRRAGVWRWTGEEQEALIGRLWGSSSQPRDLPLVHYKMNISTTFRPIGMYTV